MTHKQKAIELLSQMPEPYKTWALENLEKYPVGRENYPNTLQDAIDFFWFGWTRQGFDFWSRVYMHYKHGTPLPELPLEYRYEQLVKENEELKKKVEELKRSINQASKYTN
jgi:hypothetical protein